MKNTIIGLTTEELKAVARPITWAKARELTKPENRLYVIENSILGGQTAIIIQIGMCPYVVFKGEGIGNWFIA